MRIFGLILVVTSLFFSCGEEEKKPIHEESQTSLLPKKPKPIVLFQEDKQIDTNELKFESVFIRTAQEDSFYLKVPAGFNINIAYEGFKRIRFMDESPDQRIFVTDMHNLSDNKKGKVYILEDFDETTRSFKSKTIWKENLRNPNDVKFYTDTTGQDWIYLAETHAVTRYKYTEGEQKPSEEGEVVITFPDYGLSYKYGGWHLTRSMDFHQDKLYISIGSSCNACEELETERERASIVVVNPDGTDKKFYAEGVRNAVEIKWVNHQLFATNMGADHFGDELPDDQFLKINEGDHFGWPYCYQNGWKTVEDTSKKWKREVTPCQDVPPIYQPLGAHVAPLGFDYFENHPNKELANYFLIANHGSVKLRKGYDIVRVRNGRKETFITGFRGEGKLKHGRPCDIYQYKQGFLFTDDYKGIVYFVSK